MTKGLRMSDGTTRGGHGQALEQELRGLACALDHEAIVVEELAGALRRQRGVVASGDARALDENVEAVGRLMRTLEEARHQRIEAMASLAGGEDPSLGALATALEIRLPEALTRAGERLRQAAGQVVHEASLNRMLLKRAMDAGQEYLQTLFSAAAGPTPGYLPGERRDPGGGASGVLLDRSA